MGIYYEFYHAKSGKLICSGKYSLPIDIFNECPSVAVDLDYKTDTIKEWTTDCDSKLWKEYYVPYDWNEPAFYLSRIEATNIEVEHKGEWFSEIKFFTSMIDNDGLIGIIT